MADPHVGGADMFGYLPPVKADAVKAHDTNHHIWRYYEFLVCAWLSRMGHYVIHCDAIGFDLIVDYEGESYRVDVKSTAAIAYDLHNPRQINPTKRIKWNLRKGNHGNKDRGIHPSDTDLLALVYRPTETGLFLPVLKPIKEFKVKTSLMQAAGDGSSSLKSAIERLRQQRDRLTFT
jgi:hypothetical protein